MSRRNRLAVIVTGLLTLPLAASAAGLNAAALKQTQTAAAHAGMALGAGRLAMAHAHLHHVLNCLEGPKGMDFDAKALDPCKGMGQGAITDAAADPAAQARLRMAAEVAVRGLKTTTLAAAHADARQVMDDLQAVSRGGSGGGM